MMRIYLPTLAVAIIAGLVIGSSSCKEVDDRFCFKPWPDSVFHFTPHISDSGGMPGNTSFKQQLLEFTLQEVQQKEGLHVIQFVFKGLSITQPGVTISQLGQKKVLL